MDLSKIYFDSNGKKGNILQIVALEPEWAANMIQEGEKAIARITDLEEQLGAAQERNTELQSEHLDHVIRLYDQLTAAQVREAAYRNALMDAAKDFDRADMGNCCQHVMDELNRIINAAEAANDH